MIPHELKLYLLAVEALSSLDEVNASNSMKKTFRNLEKFARESCEAMESDELTSIGNERAVHNFSTIMNAIDTDVLSMPIGELKVTK